MNLTIHISRRLPHLSRGVEFGTQRKEIKEQYRHNDINFLRKCEVVSNCINVETRTSEMNRGQYALNNGYKQKCFRHTLWKDNSTLSTKKKRGGANNIQTQKEKKSGTSEGGINCEDEIGISASTMMWRTERRGRRNSSIVDLSSFLPHYDQDLKPYLSVFWCGVVWSTKTCVFKLFQLSYTENQNSKYGCI